MTDILYFEVDLIGILILVILLVSGRRMPQQVGKRTAFGRLALATALILFVDAVGWWVDGKSFPYAQATSLAINTVYYLLGTMIPYFWLVYCDYREERQSVVWHQRRRWLLVPLGLMLVLLLANIHSGIIFYVDEHAVYHRGSWILAYSFIVYFYLFMASARAFAGAREADLPDERNWYFVMGSFVVLPILAGLVQLLWYGLPIIWISAAVSILVLYLSIQNRQLMIDPLTGLYNRGQFGKFIESKTERAGSDSLLALIMMDVDRFKETNDTHGHLAGDQVLVEIAGILKQSCAGLPGHVFRYGGDEFCIVYQASNVAAVEQLVKRIENNIEIWNREHQQTVQIGLSLGYAIRKSGASNSLQSWVARADQEMYRNKAKKYADQNDDRTFFSAPVSFEPTTGFAATPERNG